MIGIGDKVTWIESTGPGTVMRIGKVFSYGDRPASGDESYLVHQDETNRIFKVWRERNHVVVIALAARYDGDGADAKVAAVYDKITITRPPLLPIDSDARKGIPMATGCLDYFPGALAAIAQLSKVGNDKHNPGEPLHWAREKSGDHADTILRHLAERGTVDTDGVRHSVKVAWRALALLQLELERAGETGVAITPRPL